MTGCRNRVRSFVDHRPSAGRSRFLMIALCAAFLTFPGGTARPETQTLHLLVPRSNSSLPLLLLALEDPIRDVDIQATLFQNHAQALALLLRGEVDLLLTGTSQGWENYLSGSPLLMIDTGVWGVSYLVGSKDCPPIKSVADLAGKTVALPFPGSPLDFQTRFLLQRHGLDPDRDLKLIYSPPPQTAALLLKGQIDAAPLPEPLVSQLVIDQALQRFLDYKQLWASVHGGDPKSPQVSLFTTREFAAAHAELLEQLLRHWQAAVVQVVKEPGEAASRFSDTLGFAESVIARSIPNTLYYLPSPEENRDRVRAYYETVKGFLPGKQLRGSGQTELEEDFFFHWHP
jgi:NitT/TauT family transport system substrate-binding protein